MYHVEEETVHLGAKHHPFVTAGSWICCRPAPTLKGLPPTDSPTKRLGSLICGLSPWRVSGSRVFPADTEAGARALRSVVECLGLGRLAEAEEGEEGEERG